ncbi:hypothetical protein ACFV10_10420 [Streptomyces cyaneofuscatus]|uniref:hypothetical protein n=1 Tax=Streptomyces cyaneofuscatus TaxID=66883 RepID=UPI0036B9C19E
MGKYLHLANGQVHEMTLQDIQQLTGDDITVFQFERRLRAHAHNYGCHVSARRKDDTIQFRMWRRGEQADPGGAEEPFEGLSDFLPPELVEREGRESDGRGLRLPLAPRPRVNHADCTHPNTPHERLKCRESKGRISPSAAARKAKKTTPDDVLWDSLMAEVVSNDHDHH